MKIIIDPGHGGSESGAVAFGMKEKDLNLIYARLLAEKLEKLNISVDRSILNDNYYDSNTLTKMIKNSGASLCISCHNNSVNGSARGLEVIHSIHTDGTLAKYIIQEASRTNFPVRKAYSRKSTITGKDYYFIIRLTYPEVETIIVEFGFMDNREDFTLLTNPEWQDKLTDAVANAVRCYIPGTSQINTAIIGKPILEPLQLKAALKSYNPLRDASIIYYYYEIAPIYNVKADLAFLQAVHETNWFKFTGIVKTGQNNFAGIGATSSSNPGASFPTVKAGVEAHIQHLFAYASKDPIPSGRILYDPRFGLVSRGSAKYIEDLNGKWAVPGIGYGEKILSLQRMVFEKYPPQSTTPPGDTSPTPQAHWAKECNDELLKAGLLNTDHTSTLDKSASEGMVLCLVNRLRKELLEHE